MTNQERSRAPWRQGMTHERAGEPPGLLQGRACGVRIRKEKSLDTRNGEDSGGRVGQDGKGMAHGKRRAFLALGSDGLLGHPDAKSAHNCLRA